MESLFPGYFQEVSDRRPGTILRGGPGSQLAIQNQVLEGGEEEAGEEAIERILAWMFHEFRIGEAPKFSRSASQIIQSRILSGCADFALVFKALAHQLGIPTILVQAANCEWILDLQGGNPRPVRGHFFCEVYFDGGWVLVDVARAKLYAGYDSTNLNLPGYVAFAKSRDLWETGVKNLAENNSCMIELFSTYDPRQHTEPEYSTRHLAREWFFGAEFG